MTLTPNCQITTADIDRLVAAARRAYPPAAQRSAVVERLHGVTGPRARAHAGAVVVELALAALADLAAARAALGDLPARLAAAEAECERQARDLAAARACAAEQATPASITIAAQRIAVESPLQRAILRLVAGGLGRSWRIAEAVIASGLATPGTSATNALASLVRRGLLAEYSEQGRSVTWSPIPGGRRKLLVLTEQGRLWCTAALGQPPAESELVAAARRHSSIAHGVGILETAHHMRQAGYAVDDRPPALLATGERWGRRSEPDLLATAAGLVWPVEVQRNVGDAVLPKWQKALAITGRLAIVVFNGQKQQHLLAVLRPALGALPAGEIRVASLAAMEACGWTWQTLSSSGQR